MPIQVVKNSTVFNSSVDCFFSNRAKTQHSFNTFDELEIYLGEPLSEQNECVLDWWKFNSNRFTNLSRMAKDFLSCPATSVPSECVFSTSGRVLNDYRSNLNPHTLKILICLQNWLRINSKYGWNID